MDKVVRPNPSMSDRGNKSSPVEWQGYDDIEITNRLRLMNITDEESRVMRDCLPDIETNLQTIVDQFYEHQMRHPEIAQVIGEKALFQRLHASMRKYIIEMFRGPYDKAYVDHRLTIGMVHQRIGVSPKLYMSAVSLLELTLEPHLGPTPQTEQSWELCEKRRHALHKLLMFDVHLVFDTYIHSLLSEVETAKSALENYATGLECIVAERTAELEALSRLDSLTKLGNQRAFYEDMRRELARAERFNEPVVLAYFDLNGFKGINDQNGHLVGDELLAMVGRCLRAVARETDYCYRYGGDEFCVILSNATIETAQIFIERLFTHFDAEHTYGVSFSTGLVQSGVDFLPTIEQMIRTADTNMYVAKAQSRLVPGHKVVSSVMTVPPMFTTIGGMG